MEDILERFTRKLDGGNWEWELFAVDGQSISIEVREGEVDTFKSSRNRGVSLRVRKDERIGFSFTTDFSDASFDRMLEQAAAAASAGEPNEYASFARPAGDLPVMNLEGSGAERSIEEKIEAAKRVETVALAVDRRVQRVRKSSYAESASRAWLRNVHGIDRSAASTFFSSSVLAIAEENGESQTGGEFSFGRSWDQVDFDFVGRSAGEQAVRQLGGEPLSTGKRTVVFENSVVVDLIGVLAGSFIAESVQRNRSILAGKLNETLMAPFLSLTDDPLDTMGAAAFPFDGEGLAHQTTPLIEAGVLKNFVYDIETGKKDGRASTGNSVRGGFRSPPSPGTTNLRLAPGSGSLEDLCRNAGEGFLVTDLMGVHTANPISGDFSLGAAGFAIKNGKIDRPVRGVAVADNVLELFRRAVSIGGDFRYFGSTGAASLLVPDVTVSGG